VSLYLRVHTASEAHSASYRMGTGVKQPEREGDHSPPAVSRSRMVELYLHFPIRPYSVRLPQDMRRKSPQLDLARLCAQRTT
jgi:hypothetical protein